MCFPRTISCWDDHVDHIRTYPHDWLFQYVPRTVLIYSHTFQDAYMYIYIYIYLFIYIFIYIQTYTYYIYIYICITHLFPCFPVCSMYIPTLVYFDSGTGFNKTDLVAVKSSGFRILKRKNGGRSSKIPLRRLGRRGGSQD